MISTCVVVNAIWLIIIMSLFSNSVKKALVWLAYWYLQILLCITVKLSKLCSRALVNSKSFLFVTCFSKILYVCSVIFTLLYWKIPVQNFLFLWLLETWTTGINLNGLSCIRIINLLRVILL